MTMKKRRFPAIFLTLVVGMLLLGALTAHAAAIVSGVDIKCDIPAIDLRRGKTEGEVQTRIRDKIHAGKAGYNIDVGNTWILYPVSDDDFWGTGDGSHMIVETLRYYMQAGLVTATGYSWPEQVKTAAKGKYIPVSKLPAFTVTFNGKKCSEAWVYYNESGDRLKVTIPIFNDISSGSVSIARTSFVYDGVEREPAVRSVTVNGKTLSPSHYSVSYTDQSGHGTIPRNAGKYYVVVEGRGIYGGTIKKPFTISKLANPLNAAGKKVKVKAARVKKKKQTVKCAKAMAVSDNQGTVTYTLEKVKKAKYKKFFKVDSQTGDITIKKRLKKGKYTLQIKVTAAGSTNYLPGAKIAAVTVHVK